MTPRIFGQRLRTAREEMKYTQRELGLRVGLSDRSISMYEQGDMYPPISNLLKIAKELRKDVIYFFKD